LCIYKETDIIILYFSKHPGNEQLFKLSHSASYNSSPSPENTWACSLWRTS